MISTIVVTLLLAGSIQSEECFNLENTETGDYTYHICKDTSIRDFKKAQEFCSQRLDTQRDDESKAHLVTFPNKQEFEFLMNKLNSTLEKRDMFYPGIYQLENPTNRYNPETGKFYWITDDTTQLLPNSSSYWQPFADWIEEFDTLSLSMKHVGYFLMDNQGNAYPKVTLRGTLSNDNADPMIICMSNGVEQPSIGSTQGSVSPESTVLATWVVIVIVAGGIFLLILIGVLIGFCISKKRGKFQKVPTDEKKAQQQQTPLPPPEYQA